MTEEHDNTSDKFDDEDYPAYTMGRAAEILEATQGFLRSLDDAGIITPQRSAGGHRRYSRRQLRTAARVRQLLDEGLALEAACQAPGFVETDLVGSCRRQDRVGLVV